MRSLILNSVASEKDGSPSPLVSFRVEVTYYEEVEVPRYLVLALKETQSITYLHRRWNVLQDLLRKFY